ncbi:hypothetical protein [Streptomyces sp. NBC_00842]|uniref:hypothetical protein n=1 Tax=Streptomyces sp. NBC_00842 TaxID=2975848 RepID=UPI00386BB701|nr:hypothetical protein OH821_44640 [Streptomyces sp. NBC_00842]
MTVESTSRSASTLKHPHTWVVAAEIVVDDSVARVADFRGSFRTKTEQRIDALDTYCRACRRPFADVSKSDCAAGVDNRHLIGGDQSVRAKRKTHERQSWDRMTTPRRPPKRRPRPLASGR